MRILFSTAILILVSAQAADAFDGKRRGFVLGGGVGVAAASYTMDVSSVATGAYSNDDTQIGIGARGLRLGYGSDERFMFYVDGTIVQTSDVRNILSGVGFSAYFNDAAPSMYVTGLVGIAEVEPNGLKSHVGGGLAVGLGWEFALHMSTEVTLGWNHAKREEKGGGFNLFNDAGPAIDTKTWTFIVSINAMAY